MTTPSPQRTSKNPATSPIGAQPPRIRAKLREALMAIAREGVTQRKAAELAGMNETALGKALKKPHVADALDAMKLEFIRQQQAAKDGYKALALAHAFHLMKTANSEAVQARMVEFLAGEARSGPSVAVQVNVDRGGYEFVRPGQKLVDITPATDHASEGEVGQPPVNADD